MSDKNPKKLTSLKEDPSILDGTTQPTAQKIVDAGVLTVEDLARETPKRLSEKAGIGEDTAERAINNAIRMVDRGYITGKQLHEEMSRRTRLTTGSRKLDELLGGGIESETTTEISGKNAVGKTQLAHMLAITAQLPVEEGGLEGEVIWIDTEETFRPDRIMEICRHRELDADKILNGIYVAKAFNSRHQRVLVENLSEVCQEHDVKLVIVDSMMAHLRSEYIGRGMLAARQNVLGDILQMLSKVVQSHGLTAIYTNQVMDNPAVMYGNPEKAVGGHIMGHAATTRVHLRMGRNRSRVAKLVKSPYLGVGEATFVIDEYGIRDVEKYREEDSG